MLALAVAVLTVASLEPTSNAVAAGESSSDYVVRDVIPTHFYSIGVRHVSTPFGTPYLTRVRGNDLVTLDWDFEMGTVDAATGISRLLGALPLPAGSRVLDLVSVPEMQKVGQPATVMLSYVAKVGRCRSSVLRETSVDLSGVRPPTLGRVWFRSPCFPAENSEPATVMEMAQSGGRVVAVPSAWRESPNNIEFFFSIGDFAVARPRNIPMSKDAREMIASVVRITAPLQSRVWSSGLRNVQGLVVATVDGKQQLVSTEHGPRGGDEVNILVDGGKYGWPNTDFGVTYGPGRPADTPDKQGVHVGPYRLPLFAWVPSAGTGPIIQIKGKAFGTWWANAPGTADFLVAGMGARFLYRMRVREGAVRYVEEFQFGARIRSMVQLPGGAIVCGLDAGNDLLVLAPTSEWSLSANTFVPVV